MRVLTRRELDLIAGGDDGSDCGSTCDTGSAGARGGADNVLADLGVPTGPSLATAIAEGDVREDAGGHDAQ
jgi:hypothetical protein